MSDLIHNDFVIKVLISLISAIFGAVINYLITERRRIQDPVVETRRAVERKLSVLLSPYTIDSVKTRADISKIRQDWSAAVAEYALTVNGSLTDISSYVDQYLDSFLLFHQRKISRSEFEEKRQLATQVTIARVPSIRRRRR